MQWDKTEFRALDVNEVYQKHKNYRRQYDSMNEFNKQGDKFVEELIKAGAEYEAAFVLEDLAIDSFINSFNKWPNLSIETINNNFKIVWRKYSKDIAVDLKRMERKAKHKLKQHNYSKYRYMNFLNFVEFLTSDLKFNKLKLKIEIANTDKIY